MIYIDLDAEPTSETRIVGAPRGRQCNASRSRERGHFNSPS